MVGEQGALEIRMRRGEVKVRQLIQIHLVKLAFNVSVSPARIEGSFHSKMLQVK